MGFVIEKFVVYFGFVELEVYVIGINGNSDGVYGSNGVLKIWFIFVFDICEFIICGFYVGGVEMIFVVLW